MKKIFFLKFFVFTFIFFSSIFNVYGNENGKSIQEEYGIRVMNEFYEKEKEDILKVFNTKEEFEEFYLKNYNYNSSRDGKDVNRKIKEMVYNVSSDKKKENGGNEINGNGSQYKNFDKGEKFKGIITEGDSDFILNSLFGTSDLSLLERAGIIPSRNSGFQDFVIQVYKTLFNFYIFIGGVLIIFLIYHLIIDGKTIFKKGEGGRGKIEDIIIGFIITTVVLFGGIRLYLLIIVSGMNDIKRDIDSIPINSNEIGIENILRNGKDDFNDF